MATKFLEPFLYRLHITNNTPFELAVVSRRLAQGIWHTGGDGEGPVAVPSGATIEALAIRASTNAPKGYEFNCVWGTDKTNPPSRLTLSVSVPMAGGRNRAGLDVSGPVKVEGWTGILAIGHQFEHFLTVSSILW